MLTVLRIIFLQFYCLYTSVPLNNILLCRMISLLKAKTQRYFDLYISDTKNESGDSSSTLPIVRYYL